MNKIQEQEMNSSLFRWIAALLIGILVTTQMLCGMFARFSSEGESGDQARVAAFVFNVHDGEKAFTVDLSDIRAPGDEKEFSFVIRNQMGARVSEVAQSYRVTLTELGSLPLDIICTCDGQIENLSVGVAETEKSFTGIFEPSEGKEYTYQVKVTWPEGRNEEKYASGSGVAALKIHIAGEQID